MADGERPPNFFSIENSGAPGALLPAAARKYWGALLPCVIKKEKK